MDTVFTMTPGRPDNGCVATLEIYNDNYPEKSRTCANFESEKTGKYIKHGKEVHSAVLGLARTPKQADVVDGQRPAKPTEIVSTSEDSLLNLAVISSSIAQTNASDCSVSPATFKPTQSVGGKKRSVLARPKTASNPTRRTSDGHPISPPGRRWAEWQRKKESLDSQLDQEIGEIETRRRGQSLGYVALLGSEEDKSQSVSHDSDKWSNVTSKTLSATGRGAYAAATISQEDSPSNVREVHLRRRKRAHSSPNTVAEMKTYDLSMETIASIVRMQGLVRSYIAKREREGRILSADSAYRNVFARYYDEMMYGTLKALGSERKKAVKKRWQYVVHNVARLGKGILSTSVNRCLAVENWLESVDSKHRYGHELRLYHKYWLQSDSSLRFFQWLDYGDGRALNLPSCTRLDLETMKVIYCTPDSRRQYEVTIRPEKVNGVTYAYLSYSQCGMPVHTFPDPGKWIFVVGPDRKLYVNRKETGRFHHSSFLAGGCTMAAGKIYVDYGRLLGVEPHSGHYRPSVANLKALHSHLEQLGADMSIIQFGKPKRWEEDWPFPTSLTVLGKHCTPSQAPAGIATRWFNKYRFRQVLNACVRLQNAYRLYKARRERKGYVLDASCPWRPCIKRIYTMMDIALPALKLSSAPSEFMENGLTARIPSSDLLGGNQQSASREQLSAGQAMAMMRELSAWLEAVDSQHRAGKFLAQYHRRWALLDSNESFFQWLHNGDGKRLNLPQCSRLELEFNALVYCDGSARQQYEVVVLICDVDGKQRLGLRYKLGGASVNSHPLWSDGSAEDGLTKNEDGRSESLKSTSDDRSNARTSEAANFSKDHELLSSASDVSLINACIRSNCAHCSRMFHGNCFLFVVDWEDNFFVRRHVPGRFHFSSFLSGQTGKMAGEIEIDHHGVAKTIIPATGRYKPTSRQLKEFYARFRSCNLEFIRPDEWRGSWPISSARL